MEITSDKKRVTVGNLDYYGTVKSEIISQIKLHITLIKPLVTINLKLGFLEEYIFSLERKIIKNTYGSENDETIRDENILSPAFYRC